MTANLKPGDDVVGKEAARYVRFSSAAYGMLMLKVRRCPTLEVQLCRW